MRNVETPYRSGPLYLRRRGRIYHIVGTFDGELIRASTNTDDLRRAKDALNGVLHELDSGWRHPADETAEDWRAIAKALCARHRWHAKSRSIPFNLSAHHVYAAMKDTDFRCAVSGVPFQRSKAFRRDQSKFSPNGSRDPWSPSIDRIESRHGYVHDNVRVVCLAANLAMNQWGYDTLLRLSKAVVQNASMTKPFVDEKVTPSRHKDGEKDA
jgi:hypothetical protein